MRPRGEGNGGVGGGGRITRLFVHLLARLAASHGGKHLPCTRLSGRRNKGEGRGGEREATTWLE